MSADTRLFEERLIWEESQDEQYLDQSMVVSLPSFQHTYYREYANETMVVSQPRRRRSSWLCIESFVSQFYICTFYTPLGPAFSECEV